MFLPRVYDQLIIDDRSPVYCDVNGSEQDKTKTPNIYIVCVIMRSFMHFRRNEAIGEYSDLRVYMY